MAFIKPVMTAEPEYETDEEGNLVKITEHYAQGDVHYKIVHNLSPEVIDEDTDKPLFRTFSKLKLEDALFSEGVLDTIDAFIDSQTITNEHGQTMPLRRKYETAVDFSEAHPLFKPVVAELQRLLGWSDEKVEEILDLSVKDPE